MHTNSKGYFDVKASIKCLYYSFKVYIINMALSSQFTRLNISNILSMYIDIDR